MASGDNYLSDCMFDDSNYHDVLEETFRDYDPFADDLTYMRRLEKELTTNNILKQNLEIMRSNLEKVNASNERLRNDLFIGREDNQRKDSTIAEKDRVISGKQLIIVQQGEIIEKLNRLVKPTHQFVPARKRNRKQDLQSRPSIRKKSDRATTATVAKQLRGMVVNQQQTPPHTHQQQIPQLMHKKFYSETSTLQCQQNYQEYYYHGSNV